MQDSILAIIVSYNPDDKIISLYESIKAQVTDIVIVDNASTDINSQNILKNLSSKVKQIIYNKQNYGVPKSLNIGIDYAIKNGYNWVLTLDQDSKFYNNTYKILLDSYNKLEDKEKTFLIAPIAINEKWIQDGIVTYPTPKNFITKFLYKRHPLKNLPLPNIDEVKEVKWLDNDMIITSGSLININLFKSGVCYDEKYFLDIADFDLCLQIQEIGGKCKVALNVPFVHDFSTLTSSRVYYIVRNSIYLFKKHIFKLPKQTINCILHDTIFFQSFMHCIAQTKKYNIHVKDVLKGLTDAIFNKF